MLFDSPSSFGRAFRILTFGESHGPAVGVVLDGVKPGLPFDLEAIQQEQRLRLKWQIAPEAQALRLPPMALQILVENAIKHGIARRPEGGTLRIAAWRDDAGLGIEVRNPGRLQAASREGGIGLSYARERLRHAAGGALTLREEAGEVVAVMQVPQPAADAAGSDGTTTCLDAVPA